MVSFLFERKVIRMALGSVLAAAQGAYYTPTKRGSVALGSRYKPSYDIKSTSYAKPVQPALTGGGVAQPVVQQQQALAAATGGGISAQNTALPTYNPQAYNVNLPTIDWGFTPTDLQRGDWQTQATATAGQEIDPQLQAIKAALDQYMTQGQNVRNELNPRYTSQSLSVANWIENSVKQEAIDNAVRRNATESGWLPQQLQEAGYREAGMRGDIERQRNQELSALSALEASLTQTTGEQSTMLEGLRGKRITSELANLENTAWARSQQEKESQWTSALGGEQLRASAYGQNAANQLAGYQTQAGVAMSDADRALQAAIASTDQSNTLWQQNFQQSNTDYARQLAASQAAQGGVANDTPAYLIPGTYEWNNYQNWLLNKNQGGATEESPLERAIREALEG